MARPSIRWATIVHGYIDDLRLDIIDWNDRVMDYTMMKAPSETVRALIMPEHTAHTNSPGSTELVRI